MHFSVLYSTVLRKCVCHLNTFKVISIQVVYILSFTLKKHCFSRKIRVIGKKKKKNWIPQI